MSGRRGDHRLQTEATSPFQTEESVLQQQDSSAKDGGNPATSCLVCGGTRLARIHRTPDQVLARTDASQAMDRPGSPPGVRSTG